MDRVVETGEQAAHLTRQMLAYSGKGRFVIEPLNLSDLIPEMSGLVQPSIPKKIALQFDLDLDLPPIQADRGQVQQVFMNLVLNAAEAIGSNAGLISVKTGLEDVDERYLRRDPGGAELRPGQYVYVECATPAAAWMKPPRPKSSNHSSRRNSPDAGSGWRPWAASCAATGARSR